MVVMLVSSAGHQRGELCNVWPGLTDCSHPAATSQAGHCWLMVVVEWWWAYYSVSL